MVAMAVAISEPPSATSHFKGKYMAQPLEMFTCC